MVNFPVNRASYITQEQHLQRCLSLAIPLRAVKRRPQLSWCKASPGMEAQVRTALLVLLFAFTQTRLKIFMVVEHSETRKKGLHKDRGIKLSNAFRASQVLRIALTVAVFTFLGRFDPTSKPEFIVCLDSNIPEVSTRGLVSEDISKVIACNSNQKVPFRYHLSPTRILFLC